jgi:quercetin dioxygenase-like cupin family protein
MTTPPITDRPPAAPVRRIVTGLDAQGKSCIQIDGLAPQPRGTGINMVWRTDTIPADNSSRADIDDTPFGFELMHAGGSICVTVDYPPGMTTFMHATDTIDYVIVVRGEVTIVTETGEAKCRPGDIIVDRGILHAWRNDTTETATIAVVNIPAHPVGKGKTV